MSGHKCRHSTICLLNKVINSHKHPHDLKKPWVFPFILIGAKHLEKLCCSVPHHVSGRQTKVDDDGSECENVAGPVVFVDPAAEVLQCSWSPLELLGQREQHQQHVGEEKDRKLEDGREQPPEGERRKEGSKHVTESPDVLYCWVLNLFLLTLLGLQGTECHK